MNKLEHVGVCGVDAGLIWIGDPCYIASKDASHVFEDWPRFCDLIENDKSTQQFCYNNGFAGLGVLIKNFGGDGVYPVFIRKNKHGEVTEAVIKFQ